MDMLAHFRILLVNFPARSILARKFIRTQPCAEEVGIQANDNFCFVKMISGDSSFTI